MSIKFHLVILLIVTVVVTYRTITGARRFSVFKSHPDTRSRIRFYRQRLAGSFGVYMIGGLLLLILLGRGDALSTTPAEFAKAAQFAKAQSVIPSIAPSDFVQIAPMIAIAIVAVVLISARKSSGRYLMLGDVGALIPRNRQELPWAGLLAINAGIGEELSFRVVLPLILTHVLHDSLAAFAVANIGFGLTHLYQGWIGVLATAFIGLFLSTEYLSSGSIYFVMAIHVGINIIGLVIRPVLTGLLQRHMLHRRSL